MIWGEDHMILAYFLLSVSYIALKYVPAYHVIQRQRVGESSQGVEDECVVHTAEQLLNNL